MSEGIEQAPGNCGCPGDGICHVKICVKGCLSLPVPGADVTIKTGGGIIVATGVTGDDGCVTLNILTAGTYTVLITKAGFNNFTISQAMTCGSTYTYTLVPATGFSCGGGCGCPNPVPNTVTINDGFGDVVCVTGTIFGTWAGCAMRPATGWFMGNDCAGADPHLGTQDIPVWFGAGCDGFGGWFVGCYIVECFTFGSRYTYREGCDCSNPTGDFAFNLDCSGVGTSSSSSFTCDPLGGTYTLTCPGPGSTRFSPPKMFDVYGGTASFTLTP